MSHLDSLTVLSLEQATTLPYMTLKLVMDGARVIRLESPPRGDPNRWVGPQVLSDSQAETGFELGKESITLNLLEEAGRDILHRLIREMPIDIFATNQRPDSYKKLGIDYETLSGIKPDLIWVGITGFGPTSNEAAYDPILQARAGLMELTGESNGDPMVFGLPMVDLRAGEHAYGAVMKALYQRAVTGKGTRLDISMFQSAVSWMVSPVLLSHSFGVKAARRGNTHQFFAPVSVYPTSDGFIYLAVGNDRQWEALTGQQGFESLANEKYKHNAGRIAAVDELNGQLSAIFKNRSTAEMIEMCNKISVPVSRVNTVPQVCADPLIASQLVKARDSRSGIEIAIPPPAVISARLKEKGLTLGFPPRLGEHNESVLASLGCDASELKERGII